MSKNNAHIIKQFDTKPAFVAPQFVQTLQLFGQSEPRNQVEVDSAIPYDEMCAASLGLPASNTGKPFVFSAGLAVIPVYGVLLHRDGYVSEWATGYDYIRTRLAMAVSDPEVKGIVFDVNCYGGQATGCFELCELIYAARESKPTLALVDGHAFSGGYAVASSAEKIITTPSSEAGSIGVVIMHTSYEGMLSEMGIKTTFVHAGKHKVDGNAYQDLPPEVADRLQEIVDKSYDKFVSLVARNRGLDADAVRATEAKCFLADEALAIGLIDAIHSPYEALAAFRQELESSDTILSKGVIKMSNATPAAGGDNATVAPAATNPAVTAPAVAPTTVAAVAATEDNGDAARQAERTRVSAIVSSEHAKGREQLAQHFAFNTSMSAEDAIAALAAAPAPAATATAATRLR